jgi:hypothetical protein
MAKPTLDVDTILRRAAPVTGQHGHEIQPFGYLVRMSIALRELLRTAGMLRDSAVAVLLPDRIRPPAPDKHRPVLTQHPSTRDLAEAVDKMARGWGTQ